MGNHTEETPAEERTPVEHGVATGYQAYFKDAADHTQFDIVSIESRESFVKTFKGATPNEEEYRKWLNDNDIEIISSGHSSTEGGDGSQEGYKFTPKAKQIIHDYLNTRPMAEVEGLIFQMFENPADPDPFYNKEGITTLTKYLQEKCPRIDAKPIIELLANDGLEKYILKPIDKPKDGADAGENGEEGKEENTRSEKGQS